MHTEKTALKNPFFIGMIALGVLFLAAASFATYFWLELEALRASSASRETYLESKLSQSEEIVFTSTARIRELENLLTETQGLLEETVEEKDDLSKDLRREKNRNEEFEEQIEKIESTVGDLDKLAKTDPEILMKYSKVYFLNEHYQPAELTELEKKYLYSEAEPKFIHAKVASVLSEMIDDALEDGVKLWIVSAFRSFDTQKDLKTRYSVTYGSGANTFSADQGYSEHQLGTTVDLTTEGLGGGLGGFDTTPAYEWLTKNAHEYGFVLSYPKDNAYYIFEPWHWRYVGLDLAKDLHKAGKYFYDLDQREIDKYLISIFD